MKDAEIPSSAGPQRYRASVGDVAQMGGNRRITVKVEMRRFV
jgi:hypothetical protein